MKKREELANPNSCLNTAGDDDYVFVLKQKDPCMAATIYFWAGERVAGGMNEWGDLKITSALAEADEILLARATTREIGREAVRRHRERFSVP